ncbi:MAG: hypothetical protein H7329_02805 [Opitutaceae bacterium]|nr:hypothetical protein [Cytophagales bacterium]
MIVKLRQVQILLLFFLSLGCKPSSHEKDHTTIVEKEDRILIHYFKRNNWNYPVEIDTNNMYSNLKRRINDTIIFYLDKKIYNWCILDSVLLKNYPEQALRIYNIKLADSKSTKLVLSCGVSFYREGEKEGPILPVEGHGIVERKFLRRNEVAYLTYYKGSIKFLKWEN